VTDNVLAQMYASDFNRFRMEEVPRHLKDKYRLTTLHEELKVRMKLKLKLELKLQLSVMNK